MALGKLLKFLHASTTFFVSFFSSLRPPTFQMAIVRKLTCQTNMILSSESCVFLESPTEERDVLREVAAHMG